MANYIGISFEENRDVELEIGHVLFIDIVGYAKLSVDDRREVLSEYGLVCGAIVSRAEK